MTGGQNHTKECPACGGNNTTYWDNLESTICEDCSHVVDSKVAKSIPEVPVESPSVDGSGDSNETDWEDRISVKDNSEGNLIEVLSQTEELADDLSLSNDVAIRAAEVVAEAWKTNFMHGRTKRNTVGAAVYAATREIQESIPPGLVAQAIGADKQSLKNTYQQLKAEQELGIAPPTPAEYVNSICRELDLSQPVRETAVELLARQQSRGNPVGSAAAGIYEACSERNVELTLREVAEVSGLTKETVWRHTSRMSDT